MTAHRCPGPRCRKRIRPGQLACREHWYQVPEPIRAAVWRAWRGGEGAGSAAHTGAVAAAVARMTEIPDDERPSPRLNYRGPTAY